MVFKGSKIRLLLRKCMLYAVNLNPYPKSKDKIMSNKR